jgi:hypothetical protein
MARKTESRLILFEVDATDQSMWAMTGVTLLCTDRLMNPPILEHFNKFGMTFNTGLTR